MVRAMVMLFWFDSWVGAKAGTHTEECTSLSLTLSPGPGIKAAKFKIWDVLEY